MGGGVGPRHCGTGKGCGGGGGATREGTPPEIYTGKGSVGKHGLALALYHIGTSGIGSGYWQRNASAFLSLPRPTNECRVIPLPQGPPTS